MLIQYLDGNLNHVYHSTFRVNYNNNNNWSIIIDTSTLNQHNYCVVYYWRVFQNNVEKSLYWLNFFYRSWILVRYYEATGHSCHINLKFDPKLFEFLKAFFQNGLATCQVHHQFTIVFIKQCNSIQIRFEKLKMLNLICYCTWRKMHKKIKVEFNTFYMKFWLF